MEMQIIKDTTPPTKKVGGRKIYPFDEMGVGDSLFIDSVDGFERARRAATNYGKRYGYVFTSRKNLKGNDPVDQGGTIWRVE